VKEILFSKALMATTWATTIPTLDTLFSAEVLLRVFLLHCLRYPDCCRCNQGPCQRRR